MCVHPTEHEKVQLNKGLGKLMFLSVIINLKWESLRENLNLQAITLLSLLEAALCKCLLLIFRAKFYQISEVNY